MKIRIVTPGWAPGNFWRKMVFQFPFLATTTLAALTPPETEVEIVDENVETLDLAAPVDLVALSLITPLAPRGYEIADACRARGVKVVAGGFHPTYRTEEALAHVDSVVTGEAEGVWGKLLADLRDGRLERVYAAEEPADLSKTPMPRRDLIRDKRYFFNHTIQTTRGCPFRCEFCSVTAFFGHRVRVRPVASVEAEVRSYEGENRFIFFVDDNVIANRAHARELFEMMIPHRKRWVSHSTIDIARDPGLLELAARSGCLGLFVGFETTRGDVLQGIGKRVNRIEDYAADVRAIHDAGIGVEGSFIFGSDEEDRTVFEEVADFALETRLDAVHLFFQTPYPGTALFQRLEEKGRILDSDWSRYDLYHPIFEPARMTLGELEAGVHRAYSKIYSRAGILKRLWPPRRRTQVYLPMNWGLRRACREVGFF